MRVDQPGDDVSARNVDDRCPSWRSEGLVLDLRDLAVSDDEGCIRRNCTAYAIREIRVAKHHDRRRLLSAGDSRGRKERGNAENYSFHGSSRID